MYNDTYAASRSYARKWIIGIALGILFAIFWHVDIHPALTQMWHSLQAVPQQIQVPALPPQVTP